MGDESNANAALIDGFYEAFKRRDHAAMAACYAPDATFSDAVFKDLRGPEVAAMWRMLCLRGTDLEVEHRDVTADSERGSAHWDADYTFSASNRPVHNSIDASFTFRDGLIAEHVDRFDLWKWARQALGPPGIVLGWAPPFQSRVRAMARQNLDEFMASEASPSAPAT